MQVQMLQTMQ
jgi:hypothetical protein